MQILWKGHLTPNESQPIAWEMLPYNLLHNIRGDQALYVKIQKHAGKEKKYQFP